MQARQIYQAVQWNEINRGIETMINIGYPIEKLDNMSDYDRIRDFVQCITVINSNTPISKRYGCYTLTATRTGFRINVDINWNYSRFIYEQIIEL